MPRRYHRFETFVLGLVVAAVREVESGRVPAGADEAWSAVAVRAVAAAEATGAAKGEVHPAARRWATHAVETYLETSEALAQQHASAGGSPLRPGPGARARSPAGRRGPRGHGLGPRLRVRRTGAPASCAPCGCARRRAPGRGRPRRWRRYATVTANGRRVLEGARGGPTRSTSRLPTRHPRSCAWSSGSRRRDDSAAVGGSAARGEGVVQTRGGEAARVGRDRRRDTGPPAVVRRVQGAVGVHRAAGPARAARIAGPGDAPAGARAEQAVDLPGVPGEVPADHRPPAAGRPAGADRVDGPRHPGPPVAGAGAPAPLRLRPGRPAGRRRRPARRGGPAGGGCPPQR